MGVWYWVEVSGGGGRGGRRRRRVKLTCSPIEVGPILKKTLFDRAMTAIVTSATLTTGREDFSHFAPRRWM